MSERAFLEYLTDGSWYSANNLAQHFGVSTNAIQEQVYSLLDGGVQIEIGSDNNYRLAQPLDLLCADSIRALLVQLPCRDLLGNLCVEWLIDSTNDMALSWLDTDMPNGSVCLAEGQRKGRGRFGRNWISPLARNYYVSLIWRYTGSSDQIEGLEGLSLAAGVAVVRALHTHGFSRLGLKWPNDIFWDGRKLGGILVELRYHTNFIGIVLGVGINGDLPLATYKQINQAAVDLKTMALDIGIEPSKVTRNEVAASVLQELLILLSDYRRTGFKPWQEEWQSLDIFLGKQVALRIGDESVFGIDEGVNPLGGLYLRTDDGRRLCYSGILTTKP